MYWEIGKIVSEKTSSDGWGKSTVSSLASYLQANIPASTDFSERNIWSMKHIRTIKTVTTGERNIMDKQSPDYGSL